MGTWTLRPARPEDEQELAVLEGACFSDPWRAETLRAALSDLKYRVLVAQDEGGTVGYTAGWAMGDEGEIDRIAVLPSHRGHGLGAALLQSLERALREAGARRLFLEVRESNVAARALYERAGWSVLGRRPRYYADGSDALVMGRELDVSS
jgi:ribosomal-protein-alanine N-acetyltransferase